MSKEIIRGTFATDAGMLALWNGECFDGVIDYETWEHELIEDADIERHIRAGAFVPIYINSDGAFECVVRTADESGPACLSDREQQYHFMTSQPYLFRGGEVRLSGIEKIEADPAGTIGRYSLKAQDYAVTVSMISWDDEPGAKDESGAPTPTALPDFVILMNIADTGSGSFRTSVQTFDRPQ